MRVADLEWVSGDSRHLGMRKASRYTYVRFRCSHGWSRWIVREHIAEGAPSSYSTFWRDGSGLRTPSIPVLREADLLMLACWLLDAEHDSVPSSWKGG